MPFPRVWFLLVLLAGGCATAKVYKAGVAYEEAGQEFAAANKYLEVLGLKETHRKAREGLLQVAKVAYDEKLELATTYESAQNYASALTEYRALDSYIAALRRFEAVSFEVVDTKEKVAEMESSAAEAEYVKAEAALKQGHFLAAIEHYRAAQGFKRAYKDSDEKIATAYYGLAEKELTGKQYRKAAEHFAEALEAGGQGFRDAAARGGSLYLALGTHFLQADRCRQAVRDLRIASELLGDSGRVPLAAAEECAITPIAVMPFDNPTGVNPAGLALGDAVADQVLPAMRGKASEFVRIVDRTALDQILAEQGLSDASPKGLRGVRYLVTGKLTQVLVEEPKMSASRQTAEGRERYPCTKTNSKGESYEDECARDVLVSFMLHQGSASVKLVASVKVIDVKSGEQVAAPTLTATVNDSVQYADDFRAPNGQQVTPVPYNRAGGMEVESEQVIALSKAVRDLRPVSDLAAAALNKLSADLATAVVAQVDREQPVTDPPTLMVAGTP